MWKPSRLSFLGFIARSRVGIFTDLLQCIGSAMNYGSIMFNFILPTSFNLLPLTLGHKKNVIFPSTQCRSSVDYPSSESPHQPPHTQQSAPSCICFCWYWRCDSLYPLSDTLVFSWSIILLHLFPYIFTARRNCVHSFAIMVESTVLPVWKPTIKAWPESES